MARSNGGLTGVAASICIQAAQITSKTSSGNVTTQPLTSVVRVLVVAGGGGTAACGSGGGGGGG